MSAVESLLARILNVLQDIRVGVRSGPVGSYRSQEDAVVERLFGLELGNEVGHTYTVSEAEADAVEEIIGGEGKHRVNAAELDQVAVAINVLVGDWIDSVPFVEVSSGGLEPQVTFWEQA